MPSLTKYVYKCWMKIEMPILYQLLRVQNAEYSGENTL